MEVTGTIKVIKETQEITNNFVKREFVITTEDQYPQDLLIELVNDKCELLDHFSEGDSVKVGINLRGREWINPEGEAKYFNSIQGWKIGILDGKPSPQAAASEAAANLTEEEEDDLPF